MRGFLPLLLLAISLWLVPRPATGQDLFDLLDEIPIFVPFQIEDAETKAPPTRASAKEESVNASSPSVEELIHKVDRAMRAADALERSFNPQLPVASTSTTAPLLVPEEIHLAKIYLSHGRDPSRYLALWLWLVNPTDEAITIKREEMRLVLPGRELSPGEPPRQPGLHAVRIGKSMTPITEIPHEGEVNIAPGGARKISIAFFDLPGSQEVPEMTLTLPMGEQTTKLDLNKLALGRMQPTIERVGPQGLLAIITIGGEIDDVAAGGLVDLLERLVQEKTTRVVLTWSEDAPRVDPDIMNWLGQHAVRRLFGPAAASDNGQHPALPVGLVDLHFAELPRGTNYYDGGTRTPAHETLAEAVAAALAEPYAAIPLAELRQEITEGHPLTRPVAIAAGSRLPESDLPILLALTKDADVAIAAAAVTALRGFVAPEAIARLVEIARSGPEPLRGMAIESLAASRHGIAHAALRELLDEVRDGKSAIPLETLTRVLARYPRDMWRDTLFELSLRGEADDRREALMALARVGHPRLTESLAAALASGDQNLEHRALELLVQNTDRRSEQLALEYTLEYMREKLPTGAMTRLLRRVKDPRATALLLERLEGDSDQAMQHVDLLADIGGRKARERIEIWYPDVSPMHQSRLLRLLEELDSPKLLEFAEAALESDYSTLRNAGLKIFKENGSPAAVKFLADAMTETRDQSEIRSIAAGLAEIASPEALLTLRQTGRRGEPWGEPALEWYLQSLRQHSPGWHAFYQADGLSRSKQWSAAKEAYSNAIELDPNLIDAWAGRANVNMKLEDREAARADYLHTLELDPQDPAAITCLGILMVVEGDVEEGLEFVEAHADEFRENPLFAYNFACVKALAAIPIAQQDPAHAERLRVEAVRAVERAFELGMDDAESVAWTREDPDLQSLHGRTDFERVVSAAEAKLPVGPEQ